MNVIMNVICLVALIIAVAAWFKGPFMAVNLLTWGDQPTAYELVTDDVLVIGDLKETIAYWAPLIAIIAIVICIIAVLAQCGILARIVSFVAELPMLLAIYQATKMVDDLDEIPEVLGMGFWVVFAVFFIVAFFASSKKKAV